MGHRHFPDPFNMFGINQGHNQNHHSEQSYRPMGNAFLFLVFKKKKWKTKVEEKENKKGEIFFPC